MRQAFAPVCRIVTRRNRVGGEHARGAACAQAAAHVAVCIVRVIKDGENLSSLGDPVFDPVGTRIRPGSRRFRRFIDIEIVELAVIQAAERPTCRLIGVTLNVIASVVLNLGIPLGHDRRDGCLRRQRSTNARIHGSGTARGLC